MKLVRDESAWGVYVWWQAQDRKVLKRINTTIKDIERNGNEAKATGPAASRTNIDVFTRSTKAKFESPHAATTMQVRPRKFPKPGRNMW